MTLSLHQNQDRFFIPAITIEEKETVKDFIAAPVYVVQPNINDCKNKVDLFFRILAIEPNVILNYLITGDAPTSYVLEDLNDKIKLANASSRLSQLFKLFKSDLIKACCLNEYDLNRLLKVFPENSEEILREVQQNRLASSVVTPSFAKLGLS